MIKLSLYVNLFNNTLKYYIVIDILNILKIIYLIRIESDPE